jgi:hypothetical protein
MPTKTFNDRLTPEDKKELERWDKFLRDENKAFANANRRNRYHKLESLDENISLDGRETNKYEVTKGDSPTGEEVYLTNELIDSVVNFIGNLKEEDQIIMIYKLTDKPMSSVKLAKITGLSDKTVTARFKKHQKGLQQLLKDYI